MNKKQTKNKKQPKARSQVAAPVSFLGAVKNFWIGYFDFRGCATRREYWYAWLFIFMVSLISGLFLPDIVDTVINTLFILPILMVSVRRYRDAGVSPWFYVVPFIGFTVWGAVRQALWLQLLMLDYFAPDFIAFSILFGIWFVMNIVVCCLPAKK